MQVVTGTVVQGKISLNELLEKLRQYG